MLNLNYYIFLVELKLRTIIWFTAINNSYENDNEHIIFIVLDEAKIERGSRVMCA